MFHILFITQPPLITDINSNGGITTIQSIFNNAVMHDAATWSMLI